MGEALKFGAAPFAHYRDASKALLDGLDELVSDAVVESLEEVVVPDLDRRSDSVWGDGFNAEVWADEGEIYVGWRDRPEDAERREFGGLEDRPSPVLRMGTRATQRDLADAISDRIAEGLR